MLICHKTKKSPFSQEHLYKFLPTKNFVLFIQCTSIAKSYINNNNDNNNNNRGQVETKQQHY